VQKSALIKSSRNTDANLRKLAQALILLAEQERKLANTKPQSPERKAS
jgi:hypothetical protein